MPLQRALSVALLVAAAGCLADPEDPVPPDSPTAWAPATTECGECFEPTLASDGRYLYLTAMANEELLRGHDGTWSRLVPPPTPTGGSPSETDIFVQVDDQGRLWWHALNAAHPVAQLSIPATATHVARSDDGGESWVVNQILTWGPGDQSLGGAADRNWLVADGNLVMAICTCPAFALPQVRVSTDGGSTFGPPRPIPGTTGRILPVGSPSQGPDGTIILPYLVGVAQGTQGQVSLGVSASVTRDFGATWSTLDVVAPAQAAAWGGVQCCGFPASAAGPQGFLVAFNAADGTAKVAHSVDTLSWDVRTMGQGAAFPHPWPAWVDGQVAVGWHDTDGSVHLNLDGEDHVVGHAPSDLGDYVPIALHQGRLFTAWPTGNGLAVAGIAAAPPTP